MLQQQTAAPIKPIDGQAAERRQLRKRLQAGHAGVHALHLYKQVCNAHLQEQMSDACAEPASTARCQTPTSC